MPIGQLDNPAAANSDIYSGLTGAQLETTDIDCVNGDSVALISGTLVEVVTPYVSGAGVKFQVKRSSTTVDFLLLGVVVGAPTGGVPVGGICQVRTEGPVNMLMDNSSTTLGHPVIQSTTTLGNGHDNSTTAVLGQTIGVCLQTLTISAVNTLVSVLLHKM
jgi:hypothetical protein